MTYGIILHFDAPLQSWGTDSRFQHRSAGSAPSKSAVCGLVCAACGAVKASDAEARIIAQFSRLRMDCFCIKTNGVMVDYHTVQQFRRAKGIIDNSGTILTHRHYWQNSRYNVVLSGENGTFLTHICEAILNPVWGVWFGRKCCIPAAPIIREPVMEYSEAKTIAAANYYEAYSEVSDFNAGTDTWMDQPISFGSPDSSGRDARLYALRRINRFVPVNAGDESDFFCF